MTQASFIARYGPWAVVAGASEGLGAAFARALAARGLHVLLVARRRVELEALAEELRSQHHVKARVCVTDLAESGAANEVEASATGCDVGLLVYNAAFSAIGSFLERPVEDHLQSLQVNCHSPLVLVHRLAPAMVKRGRGGLVLMSSLTAFQGSPFVSTYGATKAFNLALAEGLWFELAPQGVDVLAVCAGAVSTPNMLRASPEGAPGMLAPQAVVERALLALGHGPSTLPGTFNRIASFFMRRLMPRRATISLMGGQTRKLLKRSAV